jgi:hypothetical protein
MGASHASELPPEGNVMKPRLAWLAFFQLEYSPNESEAEVQETAR